MIRLGLALLTMLVAAPGGSLPRLHVQQVIAKGSPLPVEGAIPYIRVVRLDGSTVLQRQLPPRLKPSATVALAPGHYRLQSWQRYCDGNCSRLDPPSDQCSRRFTLARGQRLAATITVRYGSGCRIAWS
jgi:hypothetical protein